MFVVLIRTVVLYLFIIVGIRLLGKHQIGQLEPSELVLTLIIADLASVPMQDNGIPLLSGLIPIVVLLALSSVISTLCTKSLGFRALLCGKPSVVVENGKVLQRELERCRLTIDELLEELRAIVAPLEVKEGEQDFSCLKELFGRKDVFGVDLYAAGLGRRIEGMAAELFAGPGAVRRTLHKYVSAR